MVVGDFIINGVGECIPAKVDPRYRLQTNGTTISAIESATVNERSFGIISGDITLTTDTESAILYIQNSESSKLVAERVIIGFSESTGGTGLVKSGIYVDPTGGTIITEKNPAIVVNFDSGSSVTLDGNFYTGGEGKTFVGTPLVNTLYKAAPNYDDVFPKFILGTGAASGFSITPPAGNTSITVNVNIYVYLRDYV